MYVAYGPSTGKQFCLEIHLKPSFRLRFAGDSVRSGLPDEQNEIQNALTLGNAHLEDLTPRTSNKSAEARFS